MGSSIGSIFGGNAQSDANAKAQEYQQQMYQQTKQDVNSATGTARTDLQPYADVGGNALNELAYGMGLQTPTAGYTSTNTANGSLSNYGQDQYKNDPGYTPMVNSLADLQATPGYQFTLDQGLQGVNNSAAAKGGLLSGANMKAINDYAQGQASTGYQAAWDRAQSAYQNAFGRNQQKFQNLQSMANNGQNAATNQGGYSMAGAGMLSNNNTNYGSNMSSLALSQGQQQAQMDQNLGNQVNKGLAAL